MIYIIICLTLIFICCKSYVYKFDNFRHTLTNDKDFANILTPMSMVFLSIFTWIIDVALIIILYLEWGILISIVIITVVNLVPKILSFWFPFPSYQQFLINSKKLILKNTKEEFMNHPGIVNALTIIEENTK